MAAGRVRHVDIRPCTAQRSVQERQPPESSAEERPRDCSDGLGGPRQDAGATTQRKNEEKRSRMANWSETMQEKTLDSLASVERTVLHLRREQFAGNGGNSDRNGEPTSEPASV